MMLTRHDGRIDYSRSRPRFMFCVDERNRILVDYQFIVG